MDRRVYERTGLYPTRKPERLNVVWLPDQETFAMAQTAVDIFVRSANGATRQAMLRVLRAILDAHRLRRLYLADCVVEASREPGWATIRGKHFVTGRTCPGCGAEIYRWPGPVKILGIRQGLGVDTVTYGCTCGAVFAKKEPIGEGGESGVTPARAKWRWRWDRCRPLLVFVLLVGGLATVPIWLYLLLTFVR